MLRSHALEQSRIIGATEITYKARNLELWHFSDLQQGPRSTIRRRRRGITCLTAAFTVIAPVRGRIRTMPLQASLPPIEGFYLGIRTWISVRGVPLCSGHILSVPQGRSTCDRNDLSNTRRGRCSGSSACADRRTTTGRNTMRYLLQVCFTASAVLAAGAANANEELIKMSQNPKDWVMPTQDFHPNRKRPFRACSVW